MAMLAVLKAGGAFVPLDPSHPESRLQALVQRLEASILLCSRHHADKLANVAASIIPVDKDTIDTLPTERTTIHPKAQSTNAAYIIFTSGSTGEPKVNNTDQISV